MMSFLGKLISLREWLLYAIWISYLLYFAFTVL